MSTSNERRHENEEVNVILKRLHLIAKPTTSANDRCEEIQNELLHNLSKQDQ